MQTRTRHKIGDGFIEEGSNNPKIAVRFDPDTFAFIKAASASQQVSIGGVIRAFVDAGIASIRAETPKRSEAERL